MFIIIAPILVLYATGYRFDTKSNTIIEAGTLLIRTAPKDVEILIDDTIKKDKAPAVFTTLLPGKHLVSIQKPLYYPWVQMIEIQPKMTAFAEHIVLFKSDATSSQMYKSPIVSSSLTLSPHAKWIGAQSSDATKHIIVAPVEDAQNQRIVYSLKQNEKLIALDWSPSDKKFKLETSQSLQIINTERTQERIDVKALFKYPILESRWHPHDDNIIYIRDKNSLYRLNIASKNITKILALQTDIFITESNNVYAPFEIQQLSKLYPDLNIPRTLTQSDWVLVRADGRYENAPPVIDSALEYFDPASQALSFSPDYIGQYNSQTKILSLLARDMSSQPSAEFPGKIVIPNIEQYEWAPDYSRLILFGSNQLSVLDRELKKVEAKKISSIEGLPAKFLWFPDFYHILLFYPDTVKVAELDAFHITPSINTILTIKQSFTARQISNNGKSLFISVDHQKFTEIREYLIH